MFRLRRFRLNTSEDVYKRQITLFFGASSVAHPQSSPSTTWAVTIVLPPKLLADRPATLAVLGVDGRLAEGVIVDLGSHSGIEVRVKTDKTGRAVFLAPSDTCLLYTSRCV